MYKLSDLAEMMNALLIGSPNLSKDWHLLIDSRHLIQAESAVFFALQTGQNDGHRYIRELISKGVQTFVITKDHTIYKQPDINYLVVDDTLEALQSLVQSHRHKFVLPVVGITGSNGKTIVKEWLLQLLNSHFSICVSPKSYNSQIGVPLSVWALNAEFNLGLFEAGISKPGEMQNLANIIHPNIGVLTHMGTAHDEGFDNVEQKLTEKLKLFKYCQKVLLRFDKKVLQFIDQSVLTYDFDNVNADLNIRILGSDSFATHLKGTYLGKEILLSVPFKDEASIENTCLCWLVTLFLNAFNPQAFLKLAPISMRLELKQAINGCLLINDSYSNDLNALTAAFSFLKRQSIHQKTSVILSDIEQSGLTPQVLCKQVNQLLNENKVDSFFAIGSMFKKHQNEFTSLANQYFYETTVDFLEDWNNYSFHNETILLKGARSFLFEKIAVRLEKQNHGTVLEINLTAAQHNLQFIKNTLPKKTKVMAMVKAFAYGSGSYEMAKMLESKVDYLAVAYTDEGVTLRQNGIQTPIMIMNTEEDTLSHLITHHLEPVVFSINQLKDILQYLNGRELKIHLEFDTGMHRLGFAENEAEILGDLLSQNANLRVQSVFSHLSASDESQYDDFTKHQFQVFKGVTQTIDRKIGYHPLSHISNTAAILRFNQSEYDMVRLGIGLYGIDPAGLHQNSLEPVFTLKTSISQIKTIAANESIGYSRKAIENRERKIAILAIGYADGLNRLLSNGRGSFLINGFSAPILGNVCMDMCMVDITDIICKKGDEAILFGKDKSILELAQQMNTIPYEILTAISQRVKRVYVSE